MQNNRVYEFGEEVIEMTQSEDGVYHWTGTFDKEYETKQYRIVWITVGITCLFLIIFGAILCLPAGDTGMFAAFLLPCSAVLTITFLVIELLKRSKAGSSRGYSMSDKSIWMGYRRSRADFFFHSAKHVIFTGTYIEPVQRIGGFRIYVPEEDMPFVKNYVRSRLPYDCEIEDRSCSI